MTRNSLKRILFVLCAGLFLWCLCTPAMAQTDTDESAMADMSSAGTGPAPVLYRKNNESLLEVNITTAKTFLHQADTALMKGNHPMTRIYLNKAEAEYNKFKNRFPTAIIAMDIGRAQNAVEKNHLKTAASRTRSALNTLKSIDTFGDVTAVSRSLQNAMENISAKNVTDAVQNLDIAQENINTMFMSVPDKIVELNEMFASAKTSLGNNTLNPDTLIPIRDKLTFFHSVTNLLYAKVHMDEALKLYQKNKYSAAMKEIRATRNALYKVMLNCNSGDLKEALKNLHDDIMALNPSDTQKPEFAEKLQSLNIQVHNTSISEM